MAYAQCDFSVGCAVINVGIITIFNVGDARNNLTTLEISRHVTILTGASGRMIHRLALVLIDAVLPFGISHLLVKFFRLAVLIDHLLSLLVKNGKDYRVTTPAQRGRLDVIRKPRSDAHRVFHRQSRKLIVRSVDGVGGIKLELAGESVRSSQSFLCDSMTRIARDAVARQRAI